MPLGVEYSVPAARDNFVVVGLLVTALAFYELWQARRYRRGLTGTLT